MAVHACGGLRARTVEAGDAERRDVDGKPREEVVAHDPLRVVLPPCALQRRALRWVH